MTEPLRILVLAANPLKTDKLALDDEHRLLRNKLSDNAKVGNCELLVQWAARLKDLKAGLASHQPHVVHFAGHGTEDGICLEDDTGQSSPVTKAQLAELFNSSSEHLRLVVLNACLSAVQAEAIKQSVEYVVGTTAAVADDVAVRFATHFYEELATGKTVREAHYKSQLGLASDRREQIGQYELFVRTGTDESRPLLPPMLPPTNKEILESEIADGEFVNLKFVNVSDKGASDASSGAEVAEQGPSKTKVLKSKMGSVKATNAIFINHERTRR